jgi:hypothetical protein
MGQYFRPVNLTKRETLAPADYGCGLGALAGAGSGGFGGTALLTVLVGKCFGVRPVGGRWSGDRVVIVGDYAPGGRFGVDGNLYTEAHAYANLSEEALGAAVQLVPGTAGAYRREEAFRRWNPMLTYLWKGRTVAKDAPQIEAFSYVSLDLKEKVSGLSFQSVLGRRGAAWCFYVLILDGLVGRHGSSSDPDCDWIGRWVDTRVAFQTGAELSSSADFTEIGPSIAAVAKGLR